MKQARKTFGPNRPAHISYEMVPVGKFTLHGGGSVDPKKFPEEEFDLYSIAAYDLPEPEVLFGVEIGSSKKVVYPNDVLISRIVPHIQRVWVVGENRGRRQIASGEWIILRSSAAQPRYLRYVLLSAAFHHEFLGTVSGVGGSLLRARPSEVEKILIPLPEPQMQSLIVEALDLADSICRRRQTTLDLVDDLLRAAFLEKFGDPVTNPMGWPVQRLGDVTTRITDGVHAKPNYVPRGVPFISVKDITTGTLDFSNTKFISAEEHEKYTRRCKAERGDVLYTKVGATYGRPALVETDKEFSLYVSVALLKPNRDKIESRFLREVMATTAIKRQADRSIKGIGVPDLHLNEIREFLIPVPDRPTQLAYVRQTEAMHQLQQRTRTSLTEGLDLMQSISQRVFSGRLELSCV